MSELIGKVVVPEIDLSCGEREHCQSGVYAHRLHKKKKTLEISFDGGVTEHFVTPANAPHTFKNPTEYGIFVEPLATVLRASSLNTPRLIDRTEVIGTIAIAILTMQVLHGFPDLEVNVGARKGGRKTDQPI